MAFTQGYLSIEEYDARLGQAFAARTAGDLAGLTTDLPTERINRDDPRRQAARRQVAQRALRAHWLIYLAVSILIVGIWSAVAAVDGARYFWPIWPILGVGISVIAHTVSVARMRS